MTAVDSLHLSLSCADATAEEALNKALGETGFVATAFRERYIFVSKDGEMNIALPEGYFAAARDDAEYQALNSLEQMASSENKIYFIGNDKAEAARGRRHLTGTISDFRTGDPIIGAMIYTDRDSTAATTDANGIYTLQLPYGRQDLYIRGIGLKNTVRRIAIYEDGKLDIAIEEDVYALNEVVVTSARLERVRSAILGAERIRIADIKTIPTSFGEADVIKVAMMLPGVKSVGEASSGINVRGGATDQNLIIFNDGTIYNPTHLFGILSTFNPDVVSNMELYKSSIPAQYGGRISAALDITSREGNFEKFTGSASIGLLTSSLCLDVPMGSKTSLIAGGRTTYSDWMLKMLPKKSGYKDGSAGFYDANLNFVHKADAANTLMINGYYSRDRFSFDGSDHYSYINGNGSLKWRHFFGDNATSSFTAGYDHYSYTTTNSANPADAYLMQFAIRQGFAKMDFSVSSGNHKVDFGLGGIYYSLMPGLLEPYGDESLTKADRVNEERAAESSVYLADSWEVTPDLLIYAGVRYSMFNALGPRTYNIYETGSLPTIDNITETVDVLGGKAFKTYHAPDLRFSMRYAFTDDFSFKAGVNTMQQNIHKLSNTTIMSPTDTWKLSDANIRPQRGMQVSAGLYKNIFNNSIEASIEGYYKTIKDYLDYRGGAQLTMNHHIETDVINTSGKAYGIELMLKKPQGTLTGWVSYAYARTLLRQDDPRTIKPVNDGNWYPADFDKPHEFKFVGNYKFTQRYNLSLNCEYSTGRPITLPAASYDYMGGEYVYHSERNQTRIPDYFRTDIAFIMQPTHHLTVLTHSTFSIGVYNVTGHYNVYSVNYIRENGALNGYKMAIFGAPIPYLSYNIRF
ncbi:MAG: TonB-dependent receptor [Tannerella sp.]|jgi:hypothetical protein|nr:TonB-dependent receptor [Tannerella sp.]